ASDESAVGGEHPVPQSLTDDHHARGAGPIFIVAKRSSDKGRRAECGERARADEAGADTLGARVATGRRVAHAAEVDAGNAVGGDVAERVVGATVVEERRVRLLDARCARDGDGV